MPGIISGLIGGAGAALENIGGQMFKAEVDRETQDRAEAGRMRSEERQSNLQLERAKALELFKSQEQAAPLNRLSARAQQFAAEEIPVEPGQVRNLTGRGVVSTDGQAPDTTGFKGDPGALLQQIEQSTTMTPQEKREAIEQLRAQYTADAGANREAVAGKTRKRTADEALEAALNEAKVNDLQAFSDYEAKVGKARRDERRVDIDEKKLSVQERMGELNRRDALDREDRRDERTRMAEEARDRRQQVALEAAERRAMASGQVPSGYRWKSDGTGLEFIPGGPADPTTKPAGGKPLNEGQAKALLFGTRMHAANGILAELEKDSKVFSTPGANASYIGPAVNWINSEAGQMLDQAKRDFVNAVLRRESGAVIADSEFANAEKQYFPQPGDSRKVIDQKRRNRELATRGILLEVPDGEKRIGEVLGTGGGADGSWEAPAGGKAAPKGWAIREVK